MAEKHALPRVLLVTPQYPGAGSLSVGGLYTHARELHLGLAQLGCQVTVLAPRLDGPSVVQGDVHWLSPSVQVLATPPTPDGEPSPEQLRLYSQELVAYASAITRDRRPDLIHVHDHWLAPAALELRRQLGVPLVLTVHLLHAPLRAWWGTPEDPLMTMLERHVLHQADALIAVSASMGSILRTTHAIEDRRIFVVHNGFDAAPFAATAAAAEDLRARLDLPAGPLVVYAGRMTKQKGIVPLLRSAERVIAERSDVAYVLAGARLDVPQPTPEQHEILAEIHSILARTPLLRERVRVVGDMTRTDLASLYRGASLAVVPSLYEPFGYAVVEPMAAGLPVVATAVGGIPEILDHEHTGLLVPMLAPQGVVARPDEAALAAAQLRVLGNAALARELGRKGQERVLADFTRERMAHGTLRVYQELLA